MGGTLEVVAGDVITVEGEGEVARVEVGAVLQAVRNIHNNSRKNAKANRLKSLIRAPPNKDTIANITLNLYTGSVKYYRRR